MTEISMITGRPDWTMHEGRSNSSPLFLELQSEIARLIFDDAHMLLRGRADKTAGLILAQLAHVHGFGPVKTEEDGDE